jgi:EAL domain-containing protein (putative c-di-GMP-specific phosphodiesterase class I)
VLLEELDVDAHARLPARLRTWRAELSEPYTVADHPVPVRVALGVIDRPPARTDAAGGGSTAGAPDAAAAACASALSVAAAALEALADSEALPPRALDPRSVDGLWFHAPAFDHWRDEQAAAERRWAAWLAPGAVQVRLTAVTALADGTPAGWLAETLLPAAVGIAGQSSAPAEDEAVALVVDDDVAAAATLTADGSAVPREWRGTLARAVWAQALRALEARDPGARDTWVAVPVPEGLWLDDDLQACVAGACQAGGQPAARLDLLLDERVVAARPEDIARQLQAVRAMGARVTLVGLTRGAGSLSWLARLPLTAVRVDSALVHDLPLRETAHVLVRALVQLAAEHRLLVWAEAADTPSQRRALRDAGVVWAHAGASSPSDEGRQDDAERAVAAPAVASARRSTATPA